MLYPNIQEFKEKIKTLTNEQLNNLIKILIVDAPRIHFDTAMEELENR